MRHESNLFRSSAMFDSIEVVRDMECTKCHEVTLYRHVFVNEGGLVEERCDRCYQAMETAVECEHCSLPVTDSPYFSVIDGDTHVLCSVECRGKFIDNQNEAAYEHAYSER